MTDYAALIDDEEAPKKPGNANPYASVIDAEESNAQTRRQQNVLKSVDANAEQYALAREIEKHLQIPAPVAERNLPEAQRKYKISQMDHVLRNNPAYARAMENEDFAKLSADHAQQAADILNGAGTLKEVKRSRLEQMGDAVRGGFAQARQNVTIMARELGLYNGADAEFATRVAEQERIKQRFNAAPDVQAGLERISKAETMGDALMAILEEPLAVLDTTVRSIGASSPSLLLSAGGGLVFGPAGTASGAGLGSFAVEFSNTIGDVLQERGVDFRDPYALAQAFNDKDVMAAAREKAAKRGIAISAFDAATAGVAGKLLASAKPTVRSIAPRVAVEIAMQPIGGIAGEASAQALTGEYKPGEILMEGFAELPTGIVEVRSNWRHARDNAMRTLVEDYSKANTATKTEGVLNGVIDAAAAAPITQRAPEVLAAAINDAMSEGIEVEQVYVSARQLATVFNQDPVKAAETLGIDPKELDQALASNGDIGVKVGDFVAAVAADESMRPLVEHVRMGVGEMSAAEAREWETKQGEQFKAEAEKVLAKREQETAFSQSAQQVEDFVLGELQRTGRFTESVNKSDAALHKAFAVAMAERTGMKPMDFFKQHMLRVIGDKVVGDQFDQSGKLVTDTPAFRNWFGDSKVVDADGKPLVVYHGTAKDFAQFDQNKLGDNTREESGELGFFFTAKQALSDSYAEIASRGGWAGKTEAGSPVVYPVYLSIENPKRYETASAFYRDADAYKGRLNEWRAELQSQGFDGVIVRDDFEEAIAFSPTQIKSATGNRGTFDPNDPNILHQQSVDDFLAMFDEAATIELTDAKMSKEQIDEAERQFLSAFPEGTRYGRDTRLLKRVRRESDAALESLRGDPEVSREVASRLGPFSSYQSVAEILPADSFNPNGSLRIAIFGKEQTDAGLVDEPALTITVTANGELTINGPEPGTDTFAEFKARGWADHAKGANGEVQQGWTALTNPENPGQPLPIKQLLPLLADTHARVREWRGEDYVGLHWTRATGALGGLFSQDESAVFFQSANQTETPEFKAWAGTDRPVIEPWEINDFDFGQQGPFVVRGFHGTTNTFDEFNAGIKGNVEGQFGAVNYFTSSEQDASDNYAGEGPDLTNRIEQKAEPLADEIQDLYDAVEADEGEEAAVQAIKDRYGEEVYAEDTLAMARNIVRQELHGGDEIVMEVFIRTDKPFVVGDVDSPWVDFFDDEALEDQAIQQVADNNDVTVEDVKADFDTYGDEIDDARYQIMDEQGNPVVAAVQTVASRYDFDPSDLLSELYDMASYGSVRHTRLEEFMRQSESLSYAERPDDGALVQSQMIGEIIQELGFDSIILKNANVRFKNMNMEPGTAHIHVFDADNTNVKSATDNSGAFDRNDPNIYRQDNSANRGSFNPDTNTIALLQNADLSTFLHESGHYFLEVMASVASQPDAPASVRQDFEALLTWFGIKPEMTVERGEPGDLAQSPKQTDTDEFKKWFGDSKVVDADGKPLVVYHGGPKGITAFDPARIGENFGYDKDGFFFTTEKSNIPGGAANYAGEQGEVYPVYLSLKKPYTLEQYAADIGDTLDRLMYYGGDAQSPIAIFDDNRGEIIDKAKAGGHDGIAFNYKYDESFSEGLYVAFDPAQIKSATGNNGQFDPNDPNILHQGGEQLPPPPVRTIYGRSAIDVWNQMSLEEKRQYHEQFARGFEAYLMEGKAPSVELQSLFSRFRAWLINVYKSLTALNVELTDEVRGVMDRLVATDEQIATAEAARRFAPIFQTAEQLAQLYGATPPPAKDMVRYYHGGDPSNVTGSLWFTSDLNDAIGWAGRSQGMRVWYVDVSENDPLRGGDPAFGVLPPSRIEFPAEIAERRKVFSEGQNIAQEWATYQSEHQNATDTAAAELESRSIRDMRWLANAKSKRMKELQRTAKALRAEVEMGVRAEVMSQPVYQAWQFLTGKPTKSKPAPKVDPKELNPTTDSLFAAIAKLGGIDKLEITQTWGTDPADIKAMPRPVFGMPVVRTNDGRSIDDLAQRLGEYGYLSTDENGKVDVRDLEDAFASEMRGHPVYSVQKDYAADLAPAQHFDLENYPHGKLDRAAVALLYGKDHAIVQHLDALKMLTSRDGYDPDFVADQFGFSSGDEMMRTLAAADTPKDAIEGMTDQRMLENYGDLSSPEAVERAAEKAIHNDVRARFLTRELNALRKATGKANVLLKAARQHAEARIASLKVRDAVKSAPHRAAEARSGKAAEEAFKGGDLEVAAIHKRDQLLNHELARAALGAQGEVQSAVAYFKKFDRAATRKALAGSYLDQIDQLLERFDFRKATLRDVEKRASLAKWLAEQEALGLDPVIDSRLVEEAQRQHYTTLTMEELRGLIDTVKSIEHLGRLKNKLLTSKAKRDLNAAAEDVSASIIDNANREVKGVNRITPLEKGAGLLKGFAAMHRKFASIAREMDGNKDGGTVWEYFVRTMNDAGDREVAMRGAMSEKFADLFAGLKGINLRQKVAIPELNTSLRREEMLAIALNSGNSGNVQRLLDGGINDQLRGLSAPQLMNVLNKLTDAEWDFVEGVWQMIEANRPAIAAQEKALTGVEPKWVEPEPFTLESGRVIRGGYYPAKYNADFSTRSNELEAITDLREQMRGASGRASTRNSYAKERAESVTGRPLRLDLGVIAQHINEVTHRLAWQQWLIDARRLLAHPSVDRAVRDHYGSEILQEMKKQLADIAAGDNGPTDALDKVMNHIRNGTTIAGMGWNIMTSLMQPIGLTQSVERVGFGWIGKGLAQFVAAPFERTAEIHERSSFMRDRAKTINREINDVLNRIRDERMSKVEASYFYLIQKFQQMVDVPTWLGAYEKAIAEGNAEDRAVALADQAVLDSQGGGQLKDLSRIQRGGAGQKLFTNFYSFFNTTYNLAVEAGRATDFTNPLQVGKLAANYLLLFVLPAVWGFALKEALRGDDHEDDAEKIVKRLAVEQVNYLLGTMVLAREIGSAVTGFNGYQGPAGTRFFSEVGKLVKQTGQGDVDMALVKAAANTVGIAAHLPSGQVMKSVEGTVAVMDGKAGPHAILVGPPLKN